MKRYLVIILILTVACLEQREPFQSFLLSRINQIEIQSTKKDFISETGIISPDYSLKYFNSKGEEISFPGLVPQLFLDFEEVPSLEINLSEEKIYTFFVKAGDIKSNEIQYEIIKLENAVQSVLLLGEPMTFTKIDEPIDLVSNYSIEITDIFGEKHLLELNDPRVELFYGNSKVINLSDAEIEPGEHNLSVIFGGKSSNEIEIFINDPFSIVGRIELELDSTTNNFYGLAGTSKYNFAFKIYDKENELLELNNYELKEGGNTYTSILEIPITKIGENNFFIESYGVRSNLITINGRQDKISERKTLPVVFHIYHNGEQPGTGNNIDAETIYDEIKATNLALANKYRIELPQSLNAVDTYFEIAAAKTDESGNTLNEVGIHRININQDVFTSGTTETANIMMDNMWNPYQYLNIHVFKLDNIFSYAYFPTVSNDLEGTSTYDSQNPELNYPYGIAFNNIHFGAFNQVLAHEIGHMLALEHSFGTDSCLDDDYCEDTQNYIDIPANVTENFRNGCDGKYFLSSNFMDYNNSNYNSFTFDQRERMNHVFEYGIFFPGKLGNPAPSGRVQSKYQNWKGTLNPEVQPVKCFGSVSN